MKPKSTSHLNTIFCSLLSSMSINLFQYLNIATFLIVSQDGANLLIVIQLANQYSSVLICCYTSQFVRIAVNSDAVVYGLLLSVSKQHPQVGLQCTCTGQYIPILIFCQTVTNSYSFDIVI